MSKQSIIYIHSSVTRSWFEVEVEDQNHKTVLVIETRMAIDPSDTNFNSSEFDDLVNAAVQKMKDMPNAIDSVRIVPKAYPKQTLPLNEGKSGGGSITDR